MNNQLEKLQQKPKVQAFRPVTIHLDNKNKLNKELAKEDNKKVVQKIIDKTNNNIDRSELLKRFNLARTQPKNIVEKDNTIISKMKESNNDLRGEIEANDKLLSEVRESIETSNVIRSSMEDLEKEGENIEREYDLEMEQKLQANNTGEHDNQEDVIWDKNKNSIKFFPQTIYEEGEDDNQENKNTEEDIGPEKVKTKIKKPTKSVKKKEGSENNDTYDLEEYKQLLKPLGGDNEIQRHQSYYLNNRKYFLNFINNIFLKYRDQLNEERSMINCENIMSNNVRKFSLLLHQNLIVDYLNIYTPYRGLLFYHGLGSGKTCSSIAIAEGFKTTRKVYVMLPASLEDNYLKEIKKCGDYLYKKNQHWRWIPVTSDKNASKAFEKLMSVPTEFLRKYKGAFFIDVNKPPNYNKMSIEDKKILTRQIDAMITNKYNFLHYNGLTNKKFNELTNDGTINPFDNSVVIIDEAHNFVSLIVNK